MNKMDMMITKIKISEKPYKILEAAGKEKAAIEKMMDMFQAQCQQRIAAAEEKAAIAWREIAKEANIDLMNEQWVADANSQSIVLVAKRFPDAS